MMKIILETCDVHYNVLRCYYLLQYIKVCHSVNVISDGICHFSLTNPVNVLEDHLRNPQRSLRITSDDIQCSLVSLNHNNIDTATANVY